MKLKFKMKVLIFILILTSIKLIRSEKCSKLSDCECLLNFVSCINIKLKDFPFIRKSARVTSLVLSNNSLSSINIDQQYYQLNYLKITNNWLSMVQFLQFDLKNLSKLVLDDNKIESINTTSENLPKNLQIFSARNNKLTALNEDSDFSKFQQLNKIDLS